MSGGDDASIFHRQRVGQYLRSRFDNAVSTLGGEGGGLLSRLAAARLLFSIGIRRGKGGGGGVEARRGIRR